MTTVPITCEFPATDGVAARGVVIFEPVPAAILDAALGQVIVSTPVTATLDTGGAISVTLRASDDPGLDPTGWAYRVHEKITGAPERIYYIEVPAAAAGTGIDLSTVAHAEAASGDPTAFVTLSAFAAAAAPLSVTTHDVFTGSADAASIAGRTPLVGAPWLNSGAQGVAITSGYAGSSGTGYAYAAGNPDVLACDVAWGGLATGGAMTMAWSSSATFDLANLLHFNFGPQTFLVTARQDGVSFDTLLSGTWDHAMKTDGTVYRVAVAVVGQRLVITGPNGEVFAAPLDPRVAGLRGNWVFWEPITAGGSSAKLQAVSAYTYASRKLDAFVGPAQVGNLAASIKPNSVQGAPAKRHQVTIGDESTLKFPTVAFGAATILTRLVGAHTIGAAAVTTEYPIPTGSSVKLETGNGAETVTTSASPTGNGPYVSAITGTLAKAHADGVAAAATTPAISVCSMFLNPEVGYFYLPAAVITVLQSPLYFGVALQTFLQESSAGSGVLTVGGLGAGKGSLKTGQAVTGSRPAAATVGAGAQFYDTTLNKPIWSNGTVWRDAAGNTV